MEQDPLEVFPHPHFEERAKLFHQKYDMVSVIGPGDLRYSKRSLKKYSDRTCLFCNRSYPSTPFSTLSHLLPQLIGNSDLYSDFECDNCNAKFSGFEDDLAAFLGISRSITGLTDTKKAPGFVGKKVGAKSRSFIGNNILIIAPEDAKREGSQTTITYTKNSFIPSHVYKALLKCALSLIGENEVKEVYRRALDYLMGKFALASGAIVSGYQMSHNLNLSLHVYLFQKKHKGEQIPKHVMCFHF